MKRLTEKGRFYKDIHSAVKVTKGVKPDPTAIHVTCQLPEEIREQRKKLVSLAKIYRDKQKDADIKIKSDHLMVNKQVMRDPVSIPTTQQTTVSP